MHRGLFTLQDRLQSALPDWLGRLLPRSGLTGKLLFVFGAAALLTVVVAGVAWISFNRVVGTQRMIVEEAIPTMVSVQLLSSNIPRIAALVDQLPVVSDAARIEAIDRDLTARLHEVRASLNRINQQHFNDVQSAQLRATADALERNLKTQITSTGHRLERERDERASLARYRHAVQALLGMAESMVANASATTTSNMVNVYRLFERGAQRETLFSSLDQLMEVDIDAMERMSEFQLVCVNLQGLLEQIEGVQDDRVLPALEARLQTLLATLGRRVADLRDPNLKQASRQHFSVLNPAPPAAGLITLRRQSLTQLQALGRLRAQGAGLSLQLNTQAGELVTSSGRAIERASQQGNAAVDRGVVGFLGLAILLAVALVITLWVVSRYHLLSRLSGMEKAARALSTGNYDVEIASTSNDALAPLARALKQVQENAREKERLALELRRHQGELETLVAQRTKELIESNHLLEHEVQEHAVAREAAEDANRAKNLFLGSLSHELRTPLSGVSGAARLLRETGLTPRQREYADMIGYANSTLLEILEDMLSFSRIEAGKLSLQNAPFHLRQALEDMLALQSVPALGKGIALVSDIADDVPAFVVGDRGKINQLLLNTIGNAIKFTDEGSVTLSVSVAGRAKDRAGMLDLHVVVADTGIGIPAAKLVDVFKPFFQVEETAHQKHGGAGLGLAICQRIVQAMGGDISIASVENQGTSIAFHLLVEPLESMPAPLPEEDHPAPKSAQPLTVLVVEDDPVNRLVCARYLELLGHCSVLAQDGPEALRTMSDAGASIDAILMDISLPGMSGPEVAGAIRGTDHGRWKDLPIVIMSAHLTGPLSQGLADAGYAAFLSKPFSLQALGQALAGTTVGHAHALEAPPAQDQVLDLAFLDTEADTLGEAILSELLDLFRGSLPTLFAEMDGFLALHDGPGLAARAHRLRSAASNLGMQEVIRCARVLEAAAVPQSTPDGDLRAMATALKDACMAGCEALYDWLPNRP